MNEAVRITPVKPANFVKTGLSEVSTGMPLAVLMLYVWTVISIGRPQDIFPVLQVVYPGKIAAALTLGLYLTADENQLAAERSIVRFAEFRWVMFFCVWMIICTPTSYYPGRSVSFLQDFLVRFGLYLYLVFKIINTRLRIAGLLQAITISGIMMALAAFFQTDTGGRTQVGESYDPNDLAMLMVTILPITLILALSRKGRLLKGVYLVGASFILIAIIGTKSRGGFIGLTAVAILFLIIPVSGLSRAKKFVLVTASMAVFMTTANTDYLERIGTIINNQDEGSGRTMVWKRAIVILKDHPLLGVGPNAFNTAYGDYLTNNRFYGEISRQEAGNKWQTAHNSYILVATEMGLPGLIIFLALARLSFRNLGRVARTAAGKNFECRLWAGGLLIALAGFLVCSLFLSQAYNELMYLICAVSGAMARTAGRESEAVFLPGRALPQ